MELGVVNCPDDKQHEGVVTAKVNDTVIGAYLISKIPDLCQKLIESYGPLPDYARPKIFILWHPKDFQRFQTAEDSNGLVGPTVH